MQVHLRKPVEELQLCGILAWIAGGAGQIDAFSQALVRVRELADQVPYAAAAALAYSAAGAQHLGDWDLAHELIGASTAHLDTPLATRLVARIQGDVNARRPGVPRPRDGDPAFRSFLATSAEVLHRIRRWRGPTWRPRRK